MRGPASTSVSGAAAQQVGVDVPDLERRRQRDAVDVVGQHVLRRFLRTARADSYARRRSCRAMRRTRIAAVATAGALAAAGTGVAVATSASDDAKQREQAVLEDAAGRLDVDAAELRDALAAAEDAQLDAEVKAGRITQEQADAIKQMRERSGLVLGGPGHARPRPGRPRLPRRAARRAGRGHGRRRRGARHHRGQAVPPAALRPDARADRQGPGQGLRGRRRPRSAPR